MNCVIFDLDGTLLDTSPGIIESVRYSAKEYGYPELPITQLFSFIGPPLKDSYMRCYGCDDFEAKRLVSKYREHYRRGALLKAKPYNGIFKVLQMLTEQGAHVAVATSKPQVFADEILTYFGFDQYISNIHGADLQGRLNKADLIQLCVGDRNKSNCVMIGDTEHDAKGAQKAGVPFIGVSYGFGNKAEMLKYPNIGIADVPLDIPLLLSEREMF